MRMSSPSLPEAERSRSREPAPRYAEAGRHTWAAIARDGSRESPPPKNRPSMNLRGIKKPNNFPPSGRFSTANAGKFSSDPPPSEFSRSKGKGKGKGKGGQQNSGPVTSRTSGDISGWAGSPFDKLNSKNILQNLIIINQCYRIHQK